MGWAHKRWNKIASDIKLVFHSSTISFFYSQHSVTFPYLQYCKSSPHSPIVSLRSTALTSRHLRQGLWSARSHTDFRTTFLRISFIYHAIHRPQPTFCPDFIILMKAVKVTGTQYADPGYAVLGTHCISVLRIAVGFLFCFIVKSRKYYLGFLGFHTV